MDIKSCFILKQIMACLDSLTKVRFQDFKKFYLEMKQESSANH